MIALLLSFALASDIFAADIPELEDPGGVQVEFTGQFPAALNTGDLAPWPGILVEPAYVIETKQYKVDSEYWQDMAESMHQGRVDDREDAERYARALKMKKLLAVVGVGAVAAGGGFVAGVVLK